MNSCDDAVSLLSILIRIFVYEVLDEDRLLINLSINFRTF
jgi:hypothetical protein